MECAALVQPYVSFETADKRITRTADQTLLPIGSDLF